jgi:hypothetical protein
MQVSEKYLRNRECEDRKRTDQISAPIPCWGNPSSTVTSRLVFLTDALIVALSNGRIERRFITCRNTSQIRIILSSKFPNKQYP